MKKYIVLIISFILFVPGLHAAETSLLDFGEYSNYELIETETVLPTASETTTNKIYVVDEKYYVTKSQGGGDWDYIYEGLNLAGAKVKIDDEYTTLEARAGCGNSELLFNFTCNKPSCDSSYKEGYLSVWTSGTTLRSISFYDYGANYTSCNSPQLVNYYGVNQGEQLINCPDFVITHIDSSCSVASHIMYKLETITYSWQEIYPTTNINYTSVDKDFFIFYTFNEISNFDILSSYEFTDFTDFQKLVIVLGFNTFYLGFIGFIVYLFLKLINKLITWLRELF